MGPLRVLVDNRIRIRLADLGEAADVVRGKFLHANPLYGKPRHENEPATIRTWRHDGEWLSLPRGGMARVREALREGGMSWAVDDARLWNNPAEDIPDHLRTLRPYQERLRDAALERQNCLLEGATGSGKTTVLYALLARLKRRALVMVWTESLLRQWKERAVEELGYEPGEVGIVQGASESVRPLTLAMQQTVAARFAKGDHALTQAFDLVAVDEVQRGAAPTVFAAVDPFPARYRVGVSADHTRADQKDFLIRDLFGEVAAKVDESETNAVGATVDVEVYVVPTSFRAPWYRFRQDFNRLLAEMAADEERNGLILRCARQVAAQGERVLVFSHRIEHARDIDARLCASGVPSGCLLGGAEERVSFARSVIGLKTGDLRAGVGTYQAIAQGLDLPAVSRGICATPMHNNRQQIGQVRGRICRSADGKAFGRLYYLWDRHVYGRKPVQNFAGWFQTVRVWDDQTRQWIEAEAWLRTYGRGRA